MKVLFCDLDGTLLNSHEWMIDASLGTCEHYGIPMTRETITECLRSGSSLHEFYQTFAPHVDREECTRIHRAREQDNLHLITLYEGVQETLKELRTLGITLAIVTGRMDHTFLDMTLQQYGLSDFFGAVICRSDVTHSKPEPEGIFLAMKKLGLELGEVHGRLFVVGDSKVDIEAGKRAGIRTIGALYGFTGKGLLRAGADWYINSFSEVVDILNTS